jgi:hypothetical protein
MDRMYSRFFKNSYAFPCLIVTLIFLPSCSQPVQKPAGPAAVYAEATKYFADGKLDKAVDHTEDLAKASPPNEYTDRARVLRVVIFSGEMKAYRELLDAYIKGIDKTKNSNAKSMFGAQRMDNLQHGSQTALYLAQAAHNLTEGGTLPKDLMLDAPYPNSEGPTQIPLLDRVVEGGILSPDEMASAALDAQRKGIDDVLGEALGGDRAGARNTLKGGPAKLDTYKFSIFLAKQLWSSAGIFDRKHLHEPEKYRTLCGEADEAAKIALATLKDSPDKDRTKQVKKIQDDIKAGLKNI